MGRDRRLGVVLEKKVGEGMGLGSEGGVREVWRGGGAEGIEVWMKG